MPNRCVIEESRRYPWLSPPPAGPRGRSPQGRRGRRGMGTSRCSPSAPARRFRARRTDSLAPFARVRVDDRVLHKGPQPLDGIEEAALARSFVGIEEAHQGLRLHPPEPAAVEPAGCVVASDHAAFHIDRLGEHRRGDTVERPIGRRGGLGPNSPGDRGQDQLASMSWPYDPPRSSARQSASKNCRKVPRRRSRAGPISRPSKRSARALRSVSGATASSASSASSRWKWALKVLGAFGPPHQLVRDRGPVAQEGLVIAALRLGRFAGDHLHQIKRQRPGLGPSRWRRGRRRGQRSRTPAHRGACGCPPARPRASRSRTPRPPGDRTGDRR